MNFTHAEEYEKMKLNHLYDPENKYVGDGQILGAEEEAGFDDGVDYNGTSLGYTSDTNHDGVYSYGRDIDERTEEPSTLLKDQIYGIDTAAYARRFQEEATADDTSPEYANSNAKEEDELEDDEKDNSDDIDAWFDYEPDEDTWSENPELKNTMYDLSSKAESHDEPEEELDEEQER